MSDRQPTQLRRPVAVMFVCVLYAISLSGCEVGKSEFVLETEGAKSEQGLPLLRKLGATVIRDLRGQAFRIEAAGINVSGDAVRAIATQRDLVELNLCDTCLTRSDIQTIASLAGLEVLDLSFAELPADSFLLFEQFRQLRVLNLDSTGVTDKALGRIAFIPRLSELRLRWTTVTDVGLEALTNSGSIQVLDLTGAAISDQGLRSLRNLALSKLYLEQTAVGDEGLEFLEDMTALRELNVRDTAITEAGIQHLSQLKALEVLEIGRTSLSPQSLERLQRSLPNCEIR